MSTVSVVVRGTAAVSDVLLVNHNGSEIYHRKSSFSSTSYGLDHPTKHSDVNSS